MSPYYLKYHCPMNFIFADCFKILSAKTSSLSGLGRVQLQAFPAKFTQRNICTTVSLRANKNRQRKYVFKVPPFHTYGATHRLL